jgi:hypothetical protein
LFGSDEQIRFFFPRALLRRKFRTNQQKAPQPSMRFQATKQVKEPTGPYLRAANVSAMDLRDRNDSSSATKRWRSCS